MSDKETKKDIEATFKRDKRHKTLHEAIRIEEARRAELLETMKRLKALRQSLNGGKKKDRK